MDGCSLLENIVITCTRLYNINKSFWERKFKYDDLLIITYKDWIIEYKRVKNATTKMISILNDNTIINIDVDDYICLNDLKFLPDYIIKLIKEKSHPSGSNRFIVIDFNNCSLEYYEDTDNMKLEYSNYVGPLLVSKG